jgi:hypothetical protein
MHRLLEFLRWVYVGDRVVAIKRAAQMCAGNAFTRIGLLLR